MPGKSQSVSLYMHSVGWDGCNPPGFFSLAVLLNQEAILLQSGGVRVS